MGTRWTLKVIDENGVTKVSNYCQWDGYPSGAGVNILYFLRNESYQRRLKMEVLEITPMKSKNKAIFLRYDESLRKKIEKHFKKHGCNNFSIEPWSFMFDDRDLGWRVLYNLLGARTDTSSLPMFVKECERECEYIYTIDFKKNLFKVKGLDCNLEFNLDNLPSDEEFLNYFPKDED